MSRIDCYSEQIRGVSYKPEDIVDTLDDTSIMLLRANNIRDGQINFEDVVYVKKDKVSDKQVLRIGDILICASSGSKELVGKAAQVKKDINCTFGAFCKVIRPKEIHPGFLGMYFQSNKYRRTISQASAGANINNIKNEDIDSLELDVPNTDKQKEIFEVLLKLDNVICARKKELLKLDNLIKSRFVEMIKDSKLVVRLDELISSYKAERCGDREFPVLSITRWNGLVLQSDRFKKEIASKDKSQYKVIPRNKLVLAFPIDEGLICAQSIVDYGIVSPAYSVFSIDETKVNPIVLEYILRSDKSIQYYLTKLRGTTLRRRMIPREDLDSMPISLPNMERQLQFLEEITQVTKLKFEVKKSLDETQILMDSLMQEYFG